MATRACGLAIRLTKTRRRQDARTPELSCGGHLAPVRGCGRAVNAQPGLGLGLEPSRGDGLAAALAGAVGLLVELVEGVLDVFECLDELVDQRLVFTALRRHLARIRKVGVVVQTLRAVAELRQLTTQRVALLFERGPQSLNRRVSCHQSECN